MTLGTKPPAEVTLDLSLVRALIQEQHTDLAHLALNDVGEEWDNRLFRLGDDLVVRMPRRAISATLIEHEQRWLPPLSPRLPLPVPVPRRVGRPGCGFPWSWSIGSCFPVGSARRGACFSYCLRTSDAASFPSCTSCFDVLFLRKLDHRLRPTGSL
jgi:aminoglycoside phosphotransferase (APT) family kinase protein